MRLLDLFCKQGGAGHGYHRAGFVVAGVDNEPQPRYPHRFFERDAFEYLRIHGRWFDAIHASPPCQAYSNTHKIRSNKHPALIERLREALDDWGKPYIIENVQGAPLKNPVELCGAMFGIETYRHRLFETGNGFKIEPPQHHEHVAKTTKMGRKPLPGEYMHIVGNFSGADTARQIMQMPWASRDGLREAIPPVYTEFIGTQLMEYLKGNK